MPMEYENGFWKIIIDEKNDSIELIPKKVLICPICGEELRPHHMGNIHRPKGFTGLAIDFHFKCPNCFNFVTFGMPIPLELANKLQKYQGYVFNWWSKEDEEKIKERLKSLGYW